MDLDVLLFARLRELFGAETVCVALPNDATAASLLDALCALEPELNSRRAGLRVAVNQELVSADHALRREDEVAVFPPVGGG